MKLFIKKLILWSTNPENAPRVITFSTDKINVLTGKSGTGKSTVSSIIDYCLGSEKCSIPVGMIRDMCAWYGVLLELEESEVLLARRSPVALQSPGDMFLVEGRDLSIPTVIGEHNIHIDVVKEKFNRWGGIPKLSVEEGWGDKVKTDYPSFRDMAAFNFQPQHIVANPHTLFYKTDATQHREKLGVIFPFVLGSVTTAILLKQRELNELRRKARQLQADLATRLRVSERWLAEIESYYIQARRYGLLPNGTDDRKGWTPERYLVELREVRNFLAHDRGPKVEPGLNERYVEELQAVIAQENDLAGKVGNLARRLAKMQTLETAFDEYQKTAAENKDRLSSVGWLGRKIGHLGRCPFCSAALSAHPVALKKLEETVAQFEELSRRIQVAPSRLDVEKQELRRLLRETETQLKAIREKRLAIEDRNREEAEKRQELSQIYYFAGQLNQALESYSSTGKDSELKKELDAYILRITFLAKAVDQEAIQKRSEAALESIARLMTTYAEGLQLEHRTDNVALDTKELTVKFNGLKGRTDYLWEVGSGQNWVGYHLAALFALHEFLIGRPDSPVPSFLVIDQPSQVYFPESSWNTTAEKPEYSISSLSEDIKGVQRIFGQMKAFHDRTGGKVQIIVTEHAGEITWEAVKDSINVVGNWRGEKDDYLIPKAWLSNETALVKHP